MVSKFGISSFDPTPPEGLPTSFREGGAYVISGGLGGLGFALAELLARKYRAALLLIGPTALDADSRQLLRRLETTGAKVIYVAANLAQPAMLARALKLARLKFGAIHGVFHLAGINSDASLLWKSAAAFDAVLAPNVKGAILLDELTAADLLECFVCFSFPAPILGNSGHSEYAFTHAFMDSFADWRARQVASGLRRGRTRAINCPCWSDGDVSIAAEMRQLIRADSGLDPLDVESSLRV